MDDKVIEFLEQSNFIEGEYDADSLQQAVFAWRYILTQKVLTVGAVLKTHKILMLHQKLMPDEKGYFRQVPVWIGGREGKPHFAVRELVDNWCQSANMTISNDWAEDLMEEEIKNDHIAYELIHPFVDGNGRTGRIFMNWQRLKVGLPILVIKEEEKYEYYKWFQAKKVDQPQK